MIVVAILAILSLLAAPALDAFMPDYRVNAAAKVLATEMQLVRLRAISKNVRHKVTFDADEQKITIDEVDAAGDPIDPGTPVKELFFYKTGRDVVDFKSISLGRRSTTSNPWRERSGVSSPNTNYTSTTTIGTGTGTEITFLPNGLTNTSGEFYIIATADLTNTTRDPHVRAVQIMKAGMTRKFKWDISIDADTSVTGWGWEEL